MIRELVRIERVDQGETTRSRIPRYLITANTIGEGVTRMLQVQTVNSWSASLCKHAVPERRLMWLTWDEGPYGKDLINIEPDLSAWKAIS